MISLGKNIRKAREKTGFTQEALAERIGVSRAAVARWELGEIEPKLTHLLKLSEILDVGTDELLGISKHRESNGNVLTDEAAKALEKFIKEIRK